MKFINFDDIVNKNNENHIDKNVFVPQHISNTIIIGCTGCSKTNLLFNILTLNPVFQKTIFTKELEAKYDFLLKKFPHDVKIFYQNDEYDLDSLIKGNKVIYKHVVFLMINYQTTKKLWIGLFVLERKIVQISI